MKLTPILFTAVLLAATLTPPAWAAGKSKKTSDKEREKRQAEEQEVKAEFTYGFNDVNQSIVMVSCTSGNGRSSGSGFIASMDGKTYLFTNQHVILGADKIRFKTASGQTLKPRGVEMAAARDIVRLPLGPDHQPLGVSDRPVMDAPIAVFGNSEGGGVATELYGRVSSIGSEKIEVSADFVSGNSGSPILNLDKEVIGIASYVKWKTNKKDETTVRRFCYRLTDEKWGAVNWTKYNDTYGKQYRETEGLIDSIVEIISTWYVKPSSRIDADSHPVPGLRSWSREHNAMVNKIENMLDQGSCTQAELNRINRKIRTDLMESADDLSKVCKDRARTLRMFTAKQKGMTGFLKNEFESFSDRLDRISRGIDKYSLELESFNYFRFKDK